MYSRQKFIDFLDDIIFDLIQEEDRRPYTVDKISFKAPKKFRDRVYKVQCWKCLEESQKLLPIEKLENLGDSLKLFPPKLITDSTVHTCEVCNNKFTDVERMFQSSNSKIKFLLGRFIWTINKDYKNRTKKPLVFSISIYNSPFFDLKFMKVLKDVLTSELDDLNLTQYVEIIEEGLIHYFDFAHPNIFKDE